MMENHTLNKQTMCQLTKTKHENKKHLQISMEKKKKKALFKQAALDEAANNI